MTIEELVKKFNVNGEVIDVSYCDTGNINRTLIISIMENKEVKKYILQKINTTVFNEPYLLMKNIESVTNYCKNYLKEHNEDFTRGTLSVIKTKNDSNIYRTEKDEYYRMYNFVDNARTYDNAKNSQMIYNVGKAFGRFVHMLDGYPIDGLYETIPNFHNTNVRYNDFITSIRKDPCNRVKNVQKEINFILERKDQLGIIVEQINCGNIPIRVTHNDTKINNVLIDIETNEAVCVIDLDTVMPGSALYDFGDAIRSGASLTVEDDTNLNNIGINLEYFESFTNAYLTETKEILTKTEIDYLAFSCILLTLELSMRFLTDYINGDTYFKCNYSNHNLDRCRNQIALAKDMEEKYTLMDSIVKDIVKNNKQVKVYKKN